MRRNSHIFGRIRWAALAVAASFAGALFIATTAADAVVVNDNGTLAGVALVPGTDFSTPPSGVTVQTASGCTDPALQFTPDLAFASGSTPLCWRGGSVMHANETFALTWDPYRQYWAGTRGYIEQYQRNVADGSGSFTSPFSVTSQYT